MHTLDIFHPFCSRSIWGVVISWHDPVFRRPSNSPCFGQIDDPFFAAIPSNLFADGLPIGACDAIHAFLRQIWDHRRRLEIKCGTKVVYDLVLVHMSSNNVSARVKCASWREASEKTMVEPLSLADSRTSPRPYHNSVICLFVLPHPIERMA